MSAKVKRAGRAGQRADRTRVSGKHQITIPIDAFSEAGLSEGDIVQVTAQGSGRVLVARVQDLVDEYAGTLSSGGELGRTVAGLRDEWHRS